MNGDATQPEEDTPGDTRGKSLLNTEVSDDLEPLEEAGSISRSKTELAESQDLNTLARGREPETLEAPTTAKFDLQTRQERTRARLAFFLLGSLCFTLILTGFTIVLSLLKPSSSLEERPASKELIVLIWTSQVTLVGSALGFYFGTK